MIRNTTIEDNWDGSDRDFGPYGQITIWCITAPSVAYTISAGSSLKKVAQSAVLDAGTGAFTVVSTISAVGRYTVSGNCYIKLTGGTGGNFMIAGAQ